MRLPVMRHAGPENASFAPSQMRFIIRGAMPNLKELEGQVIAIFFVNQAYPNGLQRIKAKLSHVDDHGIWLENQQLTEDTLPKVGPCSGPACDDVFLSVCCHPRDCDKHSWPVSFGNSIRYVVS